MSLSRSFDYVSPFGVRPMVTTRTYREPGGVTTFTETVTTRRGRPVFEPVIHTDRLERIGAPPSTITSTSPSRRPAAGVVTSSSEYETGPDGRPSHFSSTVYKSPYGKTYRFSSHY